MTKKLVFLTMVDSEIETMSHLMDILKRLDVSDKYEFVISNTKIESINRDELIKTIQNTNSRKTKSRKCE